MFLPINNRINKFFNKNRNGYFTRYLLNVENWIKNGKFKLKKSRN